MVGCIIQKGAERLKNKPSGRSHDSRLSEGIKNLIDIGEGRGASSDEDNADIGEYRVPPAENKCLICGYMWGAGSKSGKEPLRCPGCNSTRWNCADLCRHVCKQCSHMWMSRSLTPKLCPRCRSGAWGKDVKDNVCKECGYAWKSCTSPKTCPECRSRRWNAEGLHKHVCRECAHRWTSRLELPQMCPRCTSRLWNKDMKIYSCGKCGNVWKTRCDRSKLKTCLSCGSEDTVSKTVEYMCLHCGFTGIRDDSVRRCPSCIALLPPSVPAKKAPVRNGRKAADPPWGTADPRVRMLVTEILGSDAGDTEKRMELARKAGIQHQDAGILIRYSKGEDAVRIARETGSSFERVMRAIAQMRLPQTEEEIRDLPALDPDGRGGLDCIKSQTE